MYVSNAITALKFNYETHGMNVVLPESKAAGEFKAFRSPILAKLVEIPWSSDADNGEYVRGIVNQYFDSLPR